MNDAIGQLSATTTAGFMLVLGRVGPLFLLAPALSSRAMPARARGVAAVAIALGLTPFALRGQRIPLDAVSLGVLMGKEVLVGLAFAYAVGAVVAAVSVAGSLLDSVTGYAYASLVDPVNGTQGGPIGQLYALVAAIVFIAVDGDHWLVEGVARTYQLVPLHGMPSFTALTAGVEHAFTGIFTSAVAVAAPVLLAVTITDVGFGLVSRVVPQMNVFAVGFPVKILVALLMLAASLPFTAGWLVDATRSAIETGSQMVGAR
ncbi:MAG TPA: flagellar biosynthetic protein FliR [Solirubrobacteraceae bacterium]|jgi:flagellar biosynthetic protein FliR|nr:flagellar biosynthetic protein FliR [Solirubrobacteraceae bacterium]